MTVRAAHRQARLVAALCALMGPVASAHAVRFQFVVPDGAARSTGGQAVVQWLAGPDPTGSAEFSLYASRGGIPPFGAPSYDATLDATSRVPVDGVFAWDVAGVPPGCYQPFAEVDDQVEGVTWRPAPGILAVAPADGGNLPPVIWVTTPANEPVSADGGLRLSYRVEDPDDATRVSIEWVQADGGSGVIAAGLGAPSGSTGASVLIAPAKLPAAESCFLRVKAQSDDGRSCTVWWTGRLTGAAPPDGGQGGGPPDAGQTPNRPQGCGCGAAPDALAFTSLLLTAGGFARRRRG